MQLQFGSGFGYGTVLGGSNPTPRRFMALQDVSLDISKTLKELYGTYQFPLAIAAGSAKVSGKAKYAGFKAAAFNDLFVGGTLNTGQLNSVNDEAGTVPGSVAYTITVSHSANWTEDLGVRYALTGLPLTRVSSVSATGQYSVAAGVYTFNSTDANALVQISYDWNNSASGGNVVWANPVQGTQPTFSLVFNTTYNGQQLVYRLNSCISEKFSFPSKMADWNIFEFDFQAYADASNNVMTVSAAE